MNKLVLICLLFVVPTAFAVTCSTNTLAALVGLDKLTDSTTATTLTYCQGLQGQPICCSADTINSLQTTIDTLVAEVIVEAAARDAYLLTLRSSITDTIKTSFQTLQATAVATHQIIVNANDAEAAAVVGDFEEAIEDSALLTLYTNINSALGDDAWTDYQEARATCAEKIFEAQASVYCLACRVDPDATATFVGNSQSAQLTYTNNYLTALQTACGPYLIAARQQNSLTIASLYAENAAALNTLLTTVGSNVNQITEPNLATFKTRTTVTPPTADYAEFPVIPTCDTAADCPYIFTTLLANGVKLVPEYLANGGTIEPTAASSSRRVLGEARTLQAAYDPTTDDNKSGVTVEFPTDPIAYLSAWRQGGLMTCVVALVAILLF